MTEPPAAMGQAPPVTAITWPVIPVLAAEPR